MSEGKPHIAVFDADSRKVYFATEEDEVLTEPVKDVELTRVLTYRMPPESLVKTLANNSIPLIRTRQIDSGSITSSVLSIRGKMPCSRCGKNKAMLCLQLLCTKCYLELRESIPYCTDNSTNHQVLFNRKDPNSINLFERGM